MHSPDRTRRYDTFDPGAAGDDPRKAAYLSKNILPLLREGLRGAGSAQPLVVEIGPGRGLLQRLLKAEGVSSLSLEVCEAYALALQGAGHHCLLVDDAARAIDELPERPIAAFVAVDVLEHMTLEEGTQVLRAAARRLAPGGVFVAQVPNVSGLFGLSTFAADPTHVMLYNEHSLTKVFQAGGFAQVDVFPLALPSTFADALRSLLRGVVFFAVKVLQRIVGATPCAVLTHNIVVRAVKA